MDEDADLASASRATLYEDQGEVLNLYEQVLTSRTEIGSLKKQDCTSPACRNIVYIDDISSKDYSAQDDGKVESDAGVEIEEDSSDSTSLLTM